MINTMRCATLVALGVLICPAGQSHQAAAAEEETPLARLAARMKPGEWAELSTKDYTPELLRVPRQHIYQYTHDAVWDRKSQQLLFIGQGHYAMLKFISYSAETNAWSLHPTPPWYQIDPERGRGPIGHAYDNNAIDVAGGIFFHHQYGHQQVHRWEIAKGRWLEPLTLDRKTYDRGGANSGLAYFPEMGGLVRVRSSGTIDFYDAKTGRWQVHDKQERSMGRIHPFIEYNPRHQVVIFGGGNGGNNVYQLAATGEITALQKPPFEQLDSTHRFVITADPRGGEFLVINNMEQGKFYAFDLKQNRWRLVSDSIPVKGSMIGAALADHGVVMICSYRPEQVFLYKHSE